MNNIESIKRVLIKNGFESHDNRNFARYENDNWFVATVTISEDNKSVDVAVDQTPYGKKFTYSYEGSDLSNLLKNPEDILLGIGAHMVCLQALYEGVDFSNRKEGEERTKLISKMMDIFDNSKRLEGVFISQIANIGIVIQKVGAEKLNKMTNKELTQTSEKVINDYLTRESLKNNVMRYYQPTGNPVGRPKGVKNGEGKIHKL